MDAMPSGFAPLCYQATGEGRTVVLLHGFGASGSIWQPLADGLSAHARILIPDLPGCGAARGAYDPARQPSLEAWADRLATTLQEAGTPTCTLVGHSMGGYISLAFAERYPERIDGLVLLHSTAMPDSEAKRTLRTRSIDFMQRHGVQGFLREALPALYAPAFQEAHPDQVEAHVRETLGWAEPEVLIGQYRAMMDRPDRRSVLQDPRWPTMFIAGALDKAVPLEESRLQLDVLPAGHGVVWDDVAHMGMRECPERTLACLRRFLARDKTD
jgi:pimeloyl-ACP methyl ester carboxylesterase